MLAVDSDLAGAGSSVASHTRLHSVELLVEVGNLPQQDRLPRPGPGLAVKPRTFDRPGVVLPGLGNREYELRSLQGRNKPLLLAGRPRLRSPRHRQAAAV